MAALALSSYIKYTPAIEWTAFMVSLSFTSCQKMNTQRYSDDYIILRLHVGR